LRPLDIDVATLVSQTRVWRTLRLGYLASFILDIGLTPHCIQICTGQLGIWSSQLQSCVYLSAFFSVL